MIKIIIATHGEFSREILKSAQMIMGEQEEIATVTFVPGEGLDDLIDKYNQTLNQMKNPTGVLFMIDIFGGSPFNAAATLAMQNEDFEIVTGVNLPMLLEVLSLREDMLMDELIKVAKESGCTGIVNFEKSSTDEEEEF